ncbi:unnamed protein product [Paramecium pentaurelia]|uniref:Uncharacterized protein n=1 Tax=Paramecium pentaurelia TaxID=43138 RepID=A0A8S1UCE0_9CILI|nr:unnamed protein product [Paramecium pentaurelia]
MILQIKIRWVQKKLLKWKENLFFIVFQKCSKFQIWLIKNNQVKTIFDDQMKYQHIQLSSLFFINDVQFFEPNNLTSDLFLMQMIFISKYNLQVLYLQIYLVQFENSIPIIVTSKSNSKSSIDYRIKILQFNPDVTLSFQSINQQFINQSLANTRDNIKLTTFKQQYSLFLQNLFELKVQINAHSYYTYEICNTSLHFFDLSNLFCNLTKPKRLYDFIKIIHQGLIQNLNQSIYIQFENQFIQKKCYNQMFQNSK